jgi:hypothetical protein
MRNVIALLNPTKKLSEKFEFLSCLMYNIINFASWSWIYVLLISLKNDQQISNYIYTVFIVLLTLFSSLITAFFIGALIQKRFVAKIGKKLNLNTIDPTETAWDWFFAKNKPFQIILTLKDETEICGWYADESFASSKADDRDIYVQYIYKKDENGKYQPNLESKGIYIQKCSIKYIEFKQPKEFDND